MTRKLNDADRAAVDLMFDRLNAASAANGNGNGGDAYVPVTTPVSEARLQSVERVLKPLDAMPAPEPSADLAVRTLQRIARAASTAMPAMPPHYTDPTQPMA